ncbi:MAG: hypothetical protein E4G94_10565 [ANME-2 cluster archaeon]|nr:MAG: hypothetical protein E4G94_10565 [ANME-2 cluster archaeon]
MKAFRIVIVLCIVFAFAIVDAFPQADVYKGGTWTMLPYTDPDGNVWGPYSSTQTLKMVTPTGNILITIVTQLDPSDPRIPENGVYKIPSKALYFVNNVYYETLDGEKIYTSDGKAKSVYHVNGQHEVKFEMDNSNFLLDCSGEYIQGTVVQEYKYWNSNLHMDLYGFFLGVNSGLDYSITGGCNVRIESMGKTITVPLVIKMAGKVVANADLTYYIEIDSNGEITGEQLDYVIRCR